MLSRFYIFLMESKAEFFRKRIFDEAEHDEEDEEEDLDDGDTSRSSASTTHAKRARKEKTDAGRAQAHGLCLKESFCEFLEHFFSDSG